jgi:hypothetical protein
MRAAMHWLRLFTMVLGLFACGDPHVTAPKRGKIDIASGNAQRGAPGERLALPIVVVARDIAGNPAADVQVTWQVDDGGTIDPRVSTTDDKGSTAASWTLGGDPSLHRGRAVASGYAAVQFTASTESQLPLDVIQPLTLKTFDGSGQTVHPDYVATGPEWTRSGSYLFITPYPNGNANLEDPSIYEGTDLLRWTAPLGAANPLFAPQKGYYSDPDALFVPERNELWLYFRQVTDENVIRLTTSRDGVHWTTPVVVAHAPNHQIISPTVVRRSPNDWLMWAVNGNVGCTGERTTVELRRSTNGIDWAKPEMVALSQAGVYAWHIDVQWIPSRHEFWALFNGKTSGSCTTGAVYLATSSDAVHWTTYSSPVLVHGAIPELQDVVYRSTFAYDELFDAVTIWYSGARFDGANYSWHSAVQRRLRADLFASISAPSRAAMMSQRALPPLRNFP